MRSDLIRQSDLVPENILSTPITIGGAGAIGSWVGLSLAKMGFEFIEFYDDDKVDEVNLSSQFFSKSQVGQEKVYATRDLIKAFTGVEIRARNERLTLESRPEGSIFISAVDSMQSRKAIYNAVKNTACRYLIDPRMGAETALLYVCKMTDEEDRARYQKTLYSDSQAVQERCTAKATIYTANMLSGLVCKSVRDILVGKYNWHYMWDIKNDDFEAYSLVKEVPL